jgi:dephospho-CoA kinase
MKIIAIVGMSGSGKSVIADMLTKKGFNYIRLGQITLDIIKRKGLAPTEENERPIRENLRKEHGMAAFAYLNFPRIDELLRMGNVVVDGLYSWEEYLEFKEKYREDFITLALYASPETRYKRLVGRKLNKISDKAIRFRPQTIEQSRSRDFSEIENLRKAGPIAMADYTIVNEGTLGELMREFNKFVRLFL